MPSFVSTFWGGNCSANGMVLASWGYPPAASSATCLEFINGVSVETLRHACTSWIVTFWPCKCVNSMIFAPCGGLHVIPDNTR